MNNYYEYKYGERYRSYMDYGGYSSGSSYNVDVESQTKSVPLVKMHKLLIYR